MRPHKPTTPELPTAPKSTLQFQLTDAILLAVATAWVYTVAFVFESGFADFFGFPLALIAPDISTILICAGALLGAVWVLYLFAEIFWYFAPSRSSPLASEIRNLVILEALVVIPVVIGSLGWRFFLVLNIYVVLAAIIYLGIPALSKADGVTLNERLSAAHKREHETLRKSMLSGFIEKIVERYGVSPLLGVGVFISSIALAYVVAIGQAKRDTTYFLLSDKSNTAVLRIYGSDMVTAEYDPCTKEIVGAVVIYKMNTDAPVRMIRANIGSLEPRKAINTTQLPEEF